MAVIKLFAGLVVFIALAVAGVALASTLTSSRHGDFFSPGKHQFYVWCADGASHVAYQDGKSADDAQDRLYAAVKASGQTKCWPVWQGRVSS